MNHKESCSAICYLYSKTNRTLKTVTVELLYNNCPAAATLFDFHLTKLNLVLAHFSITISGGARLSYSCIAFANNSTILATHSGVPDFQLTVW